MIKYDDFFNNGASIDRLSSTFVDDAESKIIVHHWLEISLGKLNEYLLAKNLSELGPT